MADSSESMAEKMAELEARLAGLELSTQASGVSLFAPHLLRAYQPKSLAAQESEMDAPG